MKDMAFTTEELAAKQKQYKGKSIGDVPKYPYGLTLYLNDDIVKKLGGEMPAVGSKVTITAEAEIVGQSARKQADGDKESSMEVQITAMEMGAAKTAPSETEAAKTLYGDSK